jgi:aryl-alcohol dehydrogenase-like predicted oxidoreductase
LAIAWVLSNSAVSVALSGTRTSAEIEHNVGALDVKLDQARLDERGFARGCGRVAVIRISRGIR